MGEISKMINLTLSSISDGNEIVTKVIGASNGQIKTRWVLED